MTPAERTWRWSLIGIFAVAALIRIPSLFAVTMWYDEAVEGLMSQDVLRGRFPIFFYGQPAHGVADRYFAASFLLVAGPTLLALKPPMLALFFAFLASVAYTARRMFGPRVAILTALFVAVPPYYYFGWNFDSRGHYALMLLLGVWLLYLAWQIGREGMAEAPRRRFVGLGLLAGLAWWTNYLSLTFLAPIALGLLWQGCRALGRAPRAVLERLAITAAGALVGLAPLLGYFLGHGISLVPPGRGVRGAQALAQAAGLVADGLPPTLGVHPGAWGRLYGPAYVVIAALTLGALCYGAVWWLRNRRTPGGGGTAGLLLGLVAATCVLVLTTHYGANLRFPRYLLPLTLALPVFLGLLLDRVGRASATAKWSLVTFVLVNNLLGSLLLTPLRDWGVVERERQRARHARQQLGVLEREGIRHVYGGWNHWPFLSDRRVVASDPYQERMAEFVRAVDGAERVAWVLARRTPAFERSARAAGIGFRSIDGPGFVAYTDFTLPPTGYADLDPAGWSATASHEPGHAALAHDRQLDTFWRTRVLQAPGQFYQVDLGRAERIGLIAWMPWRFQEVPAGFGVSVSLDGLAWQSVADVPTYAGPLYWSGRHPFQRVRRPRVEVRVEPVEARHVRIELTAPGREVSWSMRELVVATPTGACPRRDDPGGLVAFLRGAGVTHAYADHWISANIATLSAETIRVLPSNVSVTSYRLERPPPDTIELVRPRAGRAVVVEDCPPPVADGVAAVLDDSGVRYRRAAVGGFVVFTDLEPSEVGGAAAAWRGPEGGQVEVEVARSARRVVVECGEPLDAVAGSARLRVQGTVDGTRWEAVPFRLARIGKLRMSGSRLFRDGVETLAVEMTGGPVRGLRVGFERAGATWCPIRAVRLGLGA